MKKIGIITFHSAHNYGAMLQVYALQEKIKKLNNNPQIIDYRNINIDKHYKIWPIKSKNPLKMTKRIIKSMINYKINTARYNKFDDFMNKKLNLSRKYSSIEELKCEFPKYDIYITGSDQVWSTKILGEVSDAYTLNFGSDDVKKISYAASMGNSDIDLGYIADYKNKISKLDKISVREEDAKHSLNKIINNQIEVVLDPTLLLTKEEWEDEIKSCSKEKEKYILAYVVAEDEEYRKIVNYLSKLTGLKVIHFERRNNYDDIFKSAYTEGPLEFVNLIKNAEYVVATSFHATVFSIIFNKKFFIVPHRKTGSRVTNLLNRLGISDRAVDSLEEFKSKNYDENIDYNNVEKILSKERENSINWLKNAIEN